MGFLVIKFLFFDSQGCANRSFTNNLNLYIPELELKTYPFSGEIRTEIFEIKEKNIENFDGFENIFLVFGDNNQIRVDKNILQHKYSRSGTYMVRLEKLVENNTRVILAEKEITITDPNYDFVLRTIYEEENGKASFAVVNNGGITDNLIGTHWYFGDGATTSEGIVFNTSHEYKRNGKFVVVASLMFGDGSVIKLSGLVYIQKPLECHEELSMCTDTKGVQFCKSKLREGFVFDKDCYKEWRIEPPRGYCVTEPRPFSNYCNATKHCEIGWSYPTQFNILKGESVIFNCSEENRVFGDPSKGWGRQSEPITCTCEE